MRCVSGTLHAPLRREVTHGEVWKVGVEASRVCDAAAEEGDAQKRFGAQRQEPQAGDRHRPE